MPDSAPLPRVSGFVCVGCGGRGARVEELAEFCVVYSSEIGWCPARAELRAREIRHAETFREICDGDVITAKAAGTICPSDGGFGT